MNNKFNIRTAVYDVQKTLYSMALKLTMNSDDANDLVQDAMLKALNNEDKITHDTNFTGWMVTLMRNIFINNYRQAVRRNTIVDTTEDLYHINLSEQTSLDCPDSAYSAKEISDVIMELPVQYREPFDLFVAGYKYEEIAEKLSMPLGTVKSHIFNSRKILRNVLKDYR